MKLWRLGIWAMVLVVIMGMYFWRVNHRPPALRIDASPAEASTGGSAHLPLGDALAGTPVERFELIDQDGEPFGLENLEGEVWVASFFFATCPGFCIKLNRSIEEVVGELSDQDVRFVSISVDPENDRPADLKRYAEHFQADPEKWTFLTGDIDVIRRLAHDSFKVSADRATHSDRLFLVGPDGKLVAFFRGTDPTEVRMLKRRIEELFEEQS